MKKIDWKRFETRCQCCGVSIPVSHYNKFVISIAILLGVDERILAAKYAERLLKLGHRL